MTFLKSVICTASVAVSFLLKCHRSGIFCRLVFMYHCFGESYFHHLQVSPKRVKSLLSLVLLDYHEEGGSQLLWNMMSYSSRLDSSPAPLWEPEIFCFSLSMFKFHIHVVVWEMPSLNKISSSSLSLLVTVHHVWLWSHIFRNGDILYHSTTKQSKFYFSSSPGCGCVCTHHLQHSSSPYILWLCKHR